MVNYSFRFVLDWFEICCCFLRKFIFDWRPNHEDSSDVFLDLSLLRGRRKRLVSWEEKLSWPENKAERNFGLRVELLCITFPHTVETLTVRLFGTFYLGQNSEATQLWLPIWVPINDGLLCRYEGPTL